MKEINKAYIEKFVVRQIGSFIFSKRNMASLVKALNEYAAIDNKTLAAQKQSYRKKISNYTYKINNIIRAVESGINQHVFNDKIAEYNDRISYYKQLIETVDNETPSKYSEEDILKAKKRFIKKVFSNDAAARALIDRYVDKVIVGENKIKLLLMVDAKVSDCYR